MGIGTSLGTYHDDEMSYQSNQFFSPDPDQPGVLKPSWQTDKKGEQDAQEFQDMKTDLPTKPMPIADKSSGPTLGASYSAMMSRVLNDPDFQQVGDFGPVPIRTPEQAAAAVRSQTSNIGPDTGTRFNPTDRALEVIDRALNEGGLTAQARAGRPPANIPIEPANTTPPITTANRTVRGWDVVEGGVQQPLRDNIGNIDVKGWKEIGKKNDIALLKDPTATNKTSYGFKTDEGKTGTISLSELESGKLLYVHGMYGENGSWKGDFGTKNIRSLIPLLKDEFPNAERIRGFRVSGARRESGQGAADAEMRIRPSKQGPERKSIEQLIDEWNAGPDSSP